MNKFIQNLVKSFAIHKHLFKIHSKSSEIICHTKTPFVKRIPFNTNVDLPNVKCERDTSSLLNINFSPNKKKKIIF
jgi:hypothetical protein